MASEPCTAAAKRRPPDRKQRILASATTQFARLGFAQVSMVAVASEVGITATALYRHYRGKQDLLAAILNSTLIDLEQVVEDPGSNVDDVVQTIAQIGTANRDFGVLWARDRHALPYFDREQLTTRMRVICVRLHDRIKDAYPSADPVLAAEAILAMIFTPPAQAAEFESTKLTTEMLTNLASLILTSIPVTVDVHSSRPPRVESRRAPHVSVTRREAILDAATRLFARHGYAAVGLKDIGAAAHISGSAIYRHFGSKIEILDTIMSRGTEALSLSLSHAFDETVDADDALRRVVDSYAHFMLENPAALAVMVTELVYLPESLRGNYVRHQRNFINDWVHLVQQIHPHMPMIEGRCRVHAAIALINGLTRDAEPSTPRMLTSISQLACALLIVSPSPVGRATA
ncbi:TetR/AcrR family transcriptional regulator [Rhodococcoides fascians]|uniref:TetR/AcrR family transcriptional regulator n=1 Tax=Rhodococcoides fascians TaxID=1828 RepID=UPI00068AD4A7|nr:TetR/AcrR family transcriptional regulator [Rhodococcus fascians]